MKNGKYSSWIVIICCHTHIHNNSMSIGDKGHEMRIQISMPIYNSIVWLIHSLGLNKFLSLICIEWWRWAGRGDNEILKIFYLKNTHKVRCGRYIKISLRFLSVQYSVTQIDNQWVDGCDCICIRKVFVASRRPLAMDNKWLQSISFSSFT